MKRIVLCLLIFSLCATNSFAQFRLNNQKRPRSAIPCLSNREARDLILSLEAFQNPVSYFPSDIGVYHDHAISTVKRNYPIAYLFYQKGYVTLEYNGINTFQNLTPKGNQLRRNYSNGIPFSNQTLVSINKIVCSGRKATVTIIVLAKPTQIAIDILGASVKNTKSFGSPTRQIVYMKYVDGSWQIDYSWGNLQARIPID